MMWLSWHRKCLLPFRRRRSVARQFSLRRNCSEVATPGRAGAPRSSRLRASDPIHINYMPFDRFVSWSFVFKSLLVSLSRLFAKLR
jgi:hypothetical protein